jgi:sialic acid synthase SpsE
MRLFGIDLETRPALIAEIGVNHEGDPEKAEALLHLAADAGADAVKFQSYTAARFIAAQDAERRARVAGFALDEAAHLRLKEAAAARGVAFFSSAISEDWVPFLAEHGAAIKIASGDIDFEPVIRAAAASGRPVLISTGTADLNEVRRAVAWAEEEIGRDGLSDRLMVMHCVSAYPTPLEEANLTAIPALAEALAPVPVGYSNHVIGPEAPIAAVALGARAVEVHFTDCKEGRTFRDHALSCDPDDLAYLSRLLPQVAAGRGDGVKRAQACEAGSAAAIRKGLIAARDLPAGHRLTEADLAFARPATGFPAGARASVVGRRLARAVADGHSLDPADLTE